MTDIHRIQIDIPSIRDNKSGYEYLIKLVASLLKNPLGVNYEFRFDHCAVLDQNAIAVLGGLGRRLCLHSRSGSLKRRLYNVFFTQDELVWFDEASMSDALRTHLTDIGFLPFSQGEGRRISGVGYRSHLNFMEPSDIADYLNNDWLTEDIINLGSEIREAVVSRIIEIFTNAYGHGVKEVSPLRMGITSCGQYFPKDKKLKLTVVDFGGGIVENVKQYLHSEVPGISDAAAMQWALKPGNSTKTDSLDECMPRGLGFKLLRQFIYTNNGDLNIYSNTCHTFVDNSGIYKVTGIRPSFPGTIVTIEVNCDDVYYNCLISNKKRKYF